MVDSETIYCPNCNVPMIRRESNFANKWWYGCPNYPQCEMTCSQDKNGRMIDYPAGKHIRGLRVRAHKLLEEYFGDWNDLQNRSRMYAWLKRVTVSGHIGHATEKELFTIINSLRKRIKKREHERPDTVA